MSLALYRTYRPGRLSEVVGQEHVTEPLGRALDNDRLHHAYLLSGPRGCGKTSTARILARSMNCANGPTADPCGECTSCIELAPNGPGSLDVIELDAASHGGVDDTRDLRERAMFGPVSSRYKVYIVDEAHMVSSAGFNALLKLVEEPPEHVRFIFATTEADKVLPTIRSRTHHYTFRLVPTRTLQQHLENVCAAEGVVAEPDALALVARMGGGSVRDALSILGQLVAGAADEITYADAVTQLGVTDVALVDNTIDALATNDGAALLATVDAVVNAGHDPRRFATDLLQRLRDLIVLSAMPFEQAQPLLDAPDTEIDMMRAQVQQFDLARLSQAADLVSAALSDLRGATAPRLHLELLAARLLLPQKVAAAVSPPVARPVVSAVPEQPTKTPAPEEPKKTPPPRVDTHATPPPPPPKLSAVAPSTDKPVPPDSPVTTSAPTSVTLADVRTMWPAVLEALKSEGRTIWMKFSDAQPLSLDGNSLAVGVPQVGNLINIKERGHDKSLAQAVSSVMQAEINVDVVLVGASAAGATPAQSTGDAAQKIGAVIAPGVGEVDAPSLDDDNADGPDLTGESLAIAELGATIIGEIEQA